MIVLQHASSPSHLESPTIPTSVSLATEPSGILPLSPRGLCEAQQETSLGIEENEGLDPEPVLVDICGPLSCKLCNVTLNSAQQATAHYQGKHHSRKLRSHSAASTGLVSSGLFPLLESVSLDDTAPPVPPMASSKHGGRVILATENDYCKLCDASFSSPVVAQAHYQGKNHSKRLRLAESSSNSLLDSSKKKTTKEGNVYKVGHGRRHFSAVHDKSAPYLSPCTRQQIPRDLSMCVTPSGQFYCSMCNVGASEEAEFRQHLESKPHKSKVSEQRYRNEMENLGYL